MITDDRLLESFRALVRAEPCNVDLLDRHCAAQALILGQVHRAEAAAAQQANDSVAILDQLILVDHEPLPSAISAKALQRSMAASSSALTCSSWAESRSKA